VAIHGKVYDMTEFSEKHPREAGPIHVLADQYGSDAFSAVRNEEILQNVEDEFIGILVASK